MVLAVTFGWLGRIFVRVRHQREIAAKVTETGGKVYYDYQLANKEPPGPALIRRFLGDDCFAFLERVELHDSPCTGRVLKRLPELPWIKEVRLIGSQVDDSAVKRLTQLKELKELDFFGTRVTAKGIASLSSLDHLRSLTLAESEVTDETLQGLGSLPQIEELWLIRTHVTSDGLASISNLHNLRELFIRQNPLVVDRGLEHVGRLKNLESLNVYKNSTSDEGLAALARLKRLKKLWIGPPNVSNDAVRSLSRSLPECSIRAYTTSGPAYFMNGQEEWPRGVPKLTSPPASAPAPPDSAEPSPYPLR
jgi:hypothetical protein